MTDKEQLQQQFLARYDSIIQSGDTRQTPCSTTTPPPTTPTG